MPVFPATGDRHRGRRFPWQLRPVHGLAADAGGGALGFVGKGQDLRGCAVLPQDEWQNDGLRFSGVGIILSPMTIWLLAFLLLAGTAAVGFAQGAIRVLASFVGIVVGALTAPLLSKLLIPLLGMAGMTSPVWCWVTAMLLGFVVVLFLCKGVGYYVHGQVDTYYKYKAGDLRLALWQRLNSRLGACLGPLNGASYLVLICALLWPAGYFARQTTSGEGEKFLISLTRRVGEDLQETRMSRVAAAVNLAPESCYQIADLLGFIRYNPLASGRLARYPALITFIERQEMQAIASDSGVASLCLGNPTLTQILDQPTIKSVSENVPLLNEAWELIRPNYDDLLVFLETGKSPKYDSELLLGRWKFNVNASVVTMKRDKPTMPPNQLRFLRATLFPAMAKAGFVATPAKQASVRGYVRFQTQQAAPGAMPAFETVTMNGTWESQGGGYKLNLGESGKTIPFDASVENDRLTLRGEAVPLVFDKDIL
jgi:hypothetical protein